MHYIQIPQSDHQRKLSFYLAAEEYVAQHFVSSDYFFMWQVEPSVIFGRNQLIDNEVNVDYCLTHHIDMFRRKSGGGCVFADMSNVMLSFITPDINVNLTFNRYINMLVKVLRDMGVVCEASGRNDIMIDGRKVSGAAFYHLPNRSIVHSTLLYNTDMEKMMSSITPSGAKLQSKGVASVRQHVALLEDYTSLTLSEVIDFIRVHLCHDETITLNEDDVKAIKKIELSYLKPEFIYGVNPKYTVIKRKRIEGAGEIEARIEVHNNKIMHINLLGDYFLVGDLESLLNLLEGVSLDAESIRSALPENLSQYILNLKRDDIVSLLMDAD
jgi:lipoic acid synthetase/lipoate-protein ligase A